MGCDIHFYVEKRVDGKWVNIEGPMYLSRNYDLFAMLANVRNGRGFAGINTGDGFVPIAEPRGLPDDCSPEVKAEFDRWEGDGHSHSYFTLQELMKYDWTQTTVKRGWVGPKEFLRWKLNGRPDMWSSSIGGGGIKHIQNDEMYSYLQERVFGTDDELSWKHFHSIKDDIFTADSYTAVKWQVHYYESANEFLIETMPKLWRLGPPDDVRIVFWFDN